MDFKLSFENKYEKSHFTRVLQLTVDHFNIDAVTTSMTKDDILKARVQFHDKWHTSRELKFEDFASNIAWLTYKSDKENYEKYCKTIETKALTLVYNHVINVITPIAERLYNSLNIHLTSFGKSQYINEKLVVDTGSMDGAGKIADSKSFSL